MTECLRISIHTSNYFQTLEIWEKTLSDKNEPYTAVPFWGTNYLEFGWFVPKRGTASSLKGDYYCCICPVRQRNTIKVKYHKTCAERLWWTNDRLREECSVCGRGGKRALGVHTDCATNTCNLLRHSFLGGNGRLCPVFPRVCRYVLYVYYMYVCMYVVYTLLHVAEKPSSEIRPRGSVLSCVLYGGRRGVC